ncbi:cytochrome P450 [Roseomonas nepalensis]|uniref:Cytochrome P450 n=1 Tax=Muricoccus nepalensis TaxID=1854500 RepID=A0A502FJT4_9PROT|nr:cytochrome P450 [Roseomonas nepalensis]TPG49502.1 cytochrome P450 [Roseomonas nepalensis]
MTDSPAPAPDALPEASGEEAALAAGFDLSRLDAAFLDDPFPTYRALRRHAPVKRMRDGSLFLTRWADLDRIYRDTKTFTSDKRDEFRPKYGDTPLYEHHTTSLVFNDPPLHTRVRRLIAGALMPRAIAAMEPGLHALVARLLDRLEERGGGDLIEDFAAAIPIEVIGNLLGVPADERGPLRDWSLAILGALEPVVTPGAAARGNAAVTEFLAYLRTLVARRRAAPGDAATDVLTRLIAGEADGERLTEAELLHNCVFLLNAGHETTTNLIGNGLELLHRFPAERARLLAEPALIGTAIEETLRYESSNQLGNRRAAAEVALGEAVVPAGTLLTLCIGAANRDPDRFENPERFDIARQPNRHLAFAGGPHMCAGMNLARLEGRIAIAAFLQRFPTYTLPAAPVRGGRARFRGFLSVPFRPA